jgi:hypothetical protein
MWISGPEKSEGKGESFDACPKRMWLKKGKRCKININKTKRTRCGEKEAAELLRAVIM